MSKVEKAEMLHSKHAIGASKPILLETLEDLKQEFILNGFLYFPRFLSKEEIDHCVDLLYKVDKILEFSCPDVPRKPGDPYEVRNLLSYAPEFVEFVDREDVLMLITYLMGVNIEIVNTQAFIKPGFPKGTTLAQQKSFGWHTDMQHNAEAVNGILPRFTTRAGFFLTDLTQPNSGSLKVVPGSHRYAGKPAWNSATKEPYGTVELLMEAGSLLILDNRMWHAQCLNYSEQPRINFYMEYCWRWLKPFDHDVYPDELLNSGDLVRKQLLGYSFTDVNKGYLGWGMPKDIDNPLKAWAKEKGLGDLPMTVGNVPVGELYFD
jgi:ectoine hydroxylase